MGSPSSRQLNYTLKKPKWLLYFETSSMGIRYNVFVVVDAVALDMKRLSQNTGISSEMLEKFADLNKHVEKDKKKWWQLWKSSSTKELSSQKISAKPPLSEATQNTSDKPAGDNWLFRGVFTGSNLDGLLVENEEDAKNPITIAMWCQMKGASDDICKRAIIGDYRIVRSTKYEGWLCSFAPPELDPDE